MVFSQKRLLPPEAAPGQSDDPDRWTAQSQAPSREPEPGVEGGLAVHQPRFTCGITEPGGTVHVVPGGIPEPSPLPYEALDPCLRLAVTSHTDAQLKQQKRMFL